MAFSEIAPFSSSDGWTVHASNGGATTELSVTDGSEVRYPEYAGSVQLDGTTGAEGHYAEADLSGFDAGAFAELRLYLRATRTGDGAGTSPFLEVRLGSGAMEVDDPGNEWHRQLPIGSDGAWHTARLSLHDAPSAVRNDLQTLRLTCIDASAAFSVALHSLLAVREEVIRDTETALIERLDEQAVVDATPVPVVVYNGRPGESRTPVPPARRPRIRLVLADLQAAGGTMHRHANRRDYTGDGYALAPEADVFELFYEAELHAGTRADQAALTEFLLDAFAPKSTLVVAGLERPIRIVYPGAHRRDDGSYAPLGSVHFAVTIRRERGGPMPIAPVQTTTLSTEMLE
jgi:hypothetical protein